MMPKMPTPSPKRGSNFAVIFFAAALIMLATAVRAQQYHVDQASSTALTGYFHRHRLPLVGAQVLRTDDGNPRVNLYGFVAAVSGRDDAEREARRFLGVADVPIADSIRVKPSIDSANASGAASSGAPSTAPGNSNQEWNKAMEGIYKYGAQPLPSPGVPVPP